MKTSYFDNITHAKCFRRIARVVILIHVCTPKVDGSTDNILNLGKSIRGFYFGKSIHTRHSLEDTGTLSIFTKFPNIGFEDCVRECTERAECIHIYYVRGWAICYIGSDSTHDTSGAVPVSVSDLDTQGLHDLVDLVSVSVFGVKAEWELEDILLEPINGVEKVCGSSPNVTNSILRKGNMNRIGSKLMYRCGNKPTTELFTTCGTDGKWDPGTLKCPPKDTIDSCNRTGDVWISSRDSCYMVATGSMNHATAKAKCHAWNAHLATIGDQEEQTFIGEMLESFDWARFRSGQAPFEADWVYIGLTDEDKDGEFTWSDSTPTDFQNWETNQRMHHGEHCVVVGPHFTYQWVDVQCQRDFHALCEVDLIN